MINIKHGNKIDYDPDERYQHVIFTGPGFSGDRNLVTLFNVGGDHFYFDRYLTGSKPALYVRFSRDNNSWIKINPGDHISRKFTKFWIKEADIHSTSMNITVPSKALFYVSKGEMVIDRSNFPRGFSAPFFSSSVNFTTVLTSFADLTSANYKNMRVKRGGKIMLTLPSTSPVSQCKILGPPNFRLGTSGGIYMDVSMPASQCLILDVDDEPFMQWQIQGSSAGTGNLFVFAGPIDEDMALEDGQVISSMGIVGVDFGIPVLS